ncbi:hypothetical protein J4P91_06280 [Bacillus sp. XF8]|nr:hypothetical protein [Bacillus sp. XF8]
MNRMPKYMSSGHCLSSCPCCIIFSFLFRNFHHFFFHFQMLHNHLIYLVIPIFISGSFNSGQWCYFNKDGSMAKGWKNVNGNWYYFNEHGYMATGWLKENNNWYYLNENGSMTTGDKFIDENRYHFADNGILIGG